MVTLWIPRQIDFLGGMDWGFNGPGVLLWAAAMPNGALHIAREWKFTELADEEIAAGFHARTKQLGVTVRYVAGARKRIVDRRRHDGCRHRQG